MWDNVGKKMVRHKQSEDKSNPYQMFAMTLMVRNRISVTHLVDPQFRAVPATTLPLNVVLPKPDDWNCLRERMVVMVSRSLRENIPSLKDIKVSEHIAHEHSKESAKRSDVVRVRIPYV